MFTTATLSALDQAMQGFRVHLYNYAIDEARCKQRQAILPEDVHKAADLMIKNMDRAKFLESTIRTALFYYRHADYDAFEQTLRNAIGEGE